MGKDALLIIGGDDPSNPDALAIGPDGNLIVFDPETGAGSECCCGGGGDTGGLCCEQISNVVCSDTTGSTIPPIPCVCGRRMEFTVTGDYLRTMQENGDNGFGNEYEKHYTESLAHRAGAYWELSKPDSDDLNDCGDSWGPLGSYLHDYHYRSGGTNLIDIVFNRTVDSQASNPFVGVVRPGWPWNGVSTPNGGGSVVDILFQAIPGSPANASPYQFMFSNHVDVCVLSGHPEDAPFLRCSGSRSYSSGSIQSGSTLTASFVWDISVTCDGGTASMNYQQVYRKFNTITPGQAVRTTTGSLTAAWVVKRTLCDGTTGGFPGCAAYIAAWLSGDAAADYNGDGFVNGDDYDAFARDHPECLQVVQPGQLSAINRLRRMNRPARAGAMTFSDLLRS